MRTCSFCQNCGRSDPPANKWNANLPNWQSLWSQNWSSFQSRVNLARKSSQSGRTGWSGRTILTRPKLLLKKTSGLQWNGVTVQNQYVLFHYFHCARPLTIHSDLHAILLFFSLQPPLNKRGNRPWASHHQLSLFSRAFHDQKQLTRGIPVLCRQIFKVSLVKHFILLSAWNYLSKLGS